MNHRHDTSTRAELLVAKQKPQLVESPIEPAAQALAQVVEAKHNLRGS